MGNEMLDVDDVQLMSRLANGEDLALNVLMDRWGRRLNTFLYRMTGQQEVAVDLTQESFVRLYKARKRYRPKGEFSTYLFSIAANLARNHARWKSRHPTVSLDATNEDGVPLVTEASDPSQRPDEHADSAERYQKVREALAALPPDLREAISLFVYEGMGYAEIAGIAGCSSKAVETRIYRARQLLKGILS
mgnify:CR=1 FL=1